MDPLYFSFIIPVYNRPYEIEELLESFNKMKWDSEFEIIIIEDGSNLNCKSIVDLYQGHLNITYFFKQNSGPGDSRNYGIKRAKGNYFIILDSDCLVPEYYLDVVIRNLNRNFVHCFGGPDAAHDSFSDVQKAINFSMTSFLTTGGIRGGNKNQKDYEPRSFNMGLSKEAFQASSGFGTIHPGEDPDLAIRLKKMGYNVVLFNDAFVYHKRRISWSKFYQQVFKFGSVRPILNLWHPESSKFVYWLPTFFILGLIISLMFVPFQIYWPILAYVFYFLAAFAIAFVNTKNFLVALYAIIAIFIQFTGYGYGFLKSTFKLMWSDKTPEQQFPALFYRHVK